MNESTKRLAIIFGVILVAIIGYLIYQEQRSPADKMEDAIGDAADEIGDAIRRN